MNRNVLLVAIFLAGALWTAQGEELRGTGAQQTLSATPVAPPGAHGSLAIERSGISLEVQGLRAGNYEVGAIRSSDGAFISLGRIAVVDPNAQPERESGDSRKEDIVTHQSEILSCRAQLPLSRDFDPADVR